MNTEMQELQRRDLAHIWHPCSQMKDCEEHPPVVIRRGEGAWLFDVENRGYLDAVSSWWVNLFGHSNPRLNLVLQKQAELFEHCIFADFTHEKAIELAEGIVQLAPSGLKRVFFADNGSSAVEAALKMSFQYHQQSEQKQRKLFVAFADGYHGETIGALSVSGIDLYGKTYEPLFFPVLKTPSPDCDRCAFGMRRETCDAPCFAAMEQVFNTYGERVCAAIAEPLLLGAAGMKMYPPVYLQKLRHTCTLHGAHLIADEIAVGFGRSGSMFACEQANVSPDLMCLSKGITSGYMPLSLVLATETIYNAFYADYSEGKAFLHSHSYTGNALACALAVETLKIFEEENVIERNREAADFIRELIQKRAENTARIAGWRQLGMVAAFDIVDKKGNPFPPRERTGRNVCKKALRHGLFLRPLGDTIYFMPPYITKRNDLEFMVNTTFDILDSLQ